jgi:hypothetical protein
MDHGRPADIASPLLQSNQDRSGAECGIERGARGRYYQFINYKGAASFGSAR